MFDRAVLLCCAHIPKDPQYMCIRYMPWTTQRTTQHRLAGWLAGGRAMRASNLVTNNIHVVVINNGHRQRIILSTFKEKEPGSSKERIYYNQETPTQYEYQYNNSINGPGGGDRGLITAAQAQTLLSSSPRVFALKVVVDDPLNNNITKVISGNGRDGSIDRSMLCLMCPFGWMIMIFNGAGLDN